VDLLFEYGPVTSTAVQIGCQVLPKEGAIRHSKGHEHAAVFLKGGIHLPGVVGTHIDHIAGNHETTKRSSPNSTPQTMFRPVDVSQSTGGLPV